MGEDVAGEIVEVGEGVTTFQKGDRVFAFVHLSLFGKIIVAMLTLSRHMVSLVTNQSEDGGFQLYSAAVAAKTAKLPDSISFSEGCVLPLAFDTAAVGLYSDHSDGFLGLPLPSADAKSSGKTIVVWGGSSSVGALAIQLAVQSGAKVVSTASERNHEFCKKLGATEVSSMA